MASAEYPLLVLANPESGPEGPGEQGEPEASESLRVALDVLRARADVRVCSLDSAGALVAALERRGRRRLVVAGGDGTLHAVVRELWRRGELTDWAEPDGLGPLGLIPVGTGNDLARSLGLPLDPARAARVVLGGEDRPLDLLSDDSGGPAGAGSVVVNAVHVGLGAAVARDAQRFKPVLGAAAYPLGAVLGGLRHPGWHLRVEADGQVLADYDQRVLMVGLANGCSLAGGWGTLSPAAEPDDGLVDVLVVRATSTPARVGFGLAMRTGAHVDREDVTVVRAREVRVTGEAFDYDADGELGGPLRERTWTVRPGAWGLRAEARD